MANLFPSNYARLVVDCDLFTLAAVDFTKAVPLGRCFLPFFETRRLFYIRKIYGTLPNKHATKAVNNEIGSN